MAVSIDREYCLHERQQYTTMAINESEGSSKKLWKHNTMEQPRQDLEPLQQ